MNDPTLFALPHRKDFASAIWLPAPALKPPSFRWTEPPCELPLSADELGLAFNQFMQTNRFAGFELQLKPPVKLSAPGLPVESALAQTSTLQIQDDLAQRRLLDPINLPSWPYANVIAPSKVQLLVNEAGDVVSAVLLPPDSGYTAADQYDQADQRALELARAARFAPASRLTVGRMIFNWHTVPPPATNPPAASRSMSIPALIVIYVALLLGALCGIGIYSEMRRRRFGPTHYGGPDFPLPEMRLRLYRRRGRGPFALHPMRQAERADCVLAKSGVRGGVLE